MKKFLVILMVVAMASFLFVGCLPSVTPDEEEVVEEEEEEVVAPVSATPVLTAVETSASVSIFSVTSTSTLYMNIAEVGSSILVKGTAPSESLVQLYLDDVAITPAVGEASTSGLWTVAVAKSSLGDDGEKVLTAKVTEVGLDEGEASNAVTFILDTVRPSATTLVATADEAGTGTFTSTITAGLAVVDSFVAGTGTLATGTWTVKVLALSTTAQNIEISDGTNPVLYSVTTLANFNGVIPGIRFVFENAGLNAVGSTTTLVITNATTVVSRAKILFSEEVTNTTATTLANYVFTDTTAGAVTDPAAVSYASLYAYFNTFTVPTLTLNNGLSVTVDDMVDLAGNAQTTASYLTCSVGAASATSLAP